MNSMIRYGVAVALGLVSLQAMAADVPTQDNTLLIGGATATDRTLLESLIDPTDGICESAAAPNTAEVYFAAGASLTSPANFYVRCRVKAGVPGLAGLTIGVGKYSGGSETGIAPVQAKSPTAIPGTTVIFPDPVTSLTCTPLAAGSGSGTTFIQYQVSTGCGAVAPATGGTYDPVNPRFGISDVDPKFFGLTNAGVTVESAIDVTFAPVISRNFYSALQTAQGLTGGARTVYTSPGPDGIAGTPDDITRNVTCTDSSVTDEACLPNLTVEQVRGLYSQKILNATDFRANGVPLAAPSGGAAIRICRRGDTSGTQKSFENYFFQQFCLKSASLVFAKDTTVVSGGRQCSEVGCAFSDAAIGATGIFQGTGSGDVEACLDDAVNDGVYAIGTLSIDRVPDNAAKRFRYVKLDGVSPLLQNVVDGRYSFFSENVVVTGTGLTTAQGNIATAIKTRFRTPTLLDSTLVNNGIATNGVSKVNAGLLVRPTTAAASLPANPPVDYVTRPVNTTVKGITIGGANPTVDNCILPAFVQGVDSPVSGVLTSP